jgi:hypothetical protein
LSKINIHWICGFINSDCSFGVYSNSGGGSSRINIVISQHNSSLIVLEGIKNYFNIGQIYSRSATTVSDYKLTNLKNILLFIDLFKDAQLLGNNLIIF